MSGYDTRTMRAYQAKRRGNTSWKTLGEDAAVMVAFAAGEVSTGCAAKALGCDAVEVRRRFRVYLDAARALTGAEVADERFETVVTLAGMNPGAAESGEWRGQC